MKKTMILGLSIALIAGGFSACKKGDNDPFLSLKSRKARVAGEWKVSSSEEVSTSGSGGSGYGYSLNYDGTTATETSTYNGISETETYKYTLEYTFEKDGTYKMIHTDTDNNITSTTEGFWSFMGKNKGGELKNKEAIILTAQSETENDGSNNSTSTTVGFDYGTILYLDQLKSKEMIIVTDVEGTDSEGGTFNYKSKTVLSAK